MSRAVLRLLLAGAAVAASSACVIIIKPSDPKPVPVPLSCSGEGYKTAHVIFSARVSRSVVNLAPAYDSFMTHTLLALAGAKVLPTSAVLVRSDEREVDHSILGAWGCNVEGSLSQSLRPVPGAILTHYAQNDALREPAEGCMSDTLVTTGAKLTDATSDYPPELGGKSGVRLFSNRPDVVLVVHLDSLERKAAYDEPTCRSAGTLSAQANDGTAAWLDYAGADMQPDEIYHWFLTTEEGVSDAAFLKECKKADGILESYFDVLQPSAKAYYGPLQQALEGSGQNVASLQICRMLANQDLNFLVDEATRIGEAVGSGPDPAEIEKVINGGIEGLINSQIEGGVLEAPGTLRGGG